MPERMYIGKLAEAVGVNPKTIRYYEDIGLLPEPERTDSNYRVYTHGDVRQLAFIKKAQTLGMALDDIKDILAIRENGQLPCRHVRSVLLHKLEALDHQIAQLQAFRRELTQYWSEAEADAQTRTEEAICPHIEGFGTDAHFDASTPA